ncbi:MAG: NirD/YgiW/YdeI family stress tolerance protein [Treponema sp.]|jgi:uncharacterized protein (TIGR00156 family)|nr:NirD/YgiW/YdeI family stress tolerance protein [Treponema sp.]
MKQKVLVCLVILAAVFGSPAAAQEEGEGYTGPGLEAVTVAEAKRLRNNTPVVLVGIIERYLGDEEYLFTDDTGSIIVDIENNLWSGISVSAEDTVEITGEVDRGFRKIEIDASRITKKRD